MAGITRDNPLVEADLITERDFCFPLGKSGSGVNDSNESVLELFFSSVEALCAAAKSNLKKTKKNFNKNFKKLIFHTFENDSMKKIEEAKNT